MTSGKHIEDYLKINPAIPAQVLAWRETLPKGSIMSPSTFVKIAKAAKKKGYKDPVAVAGKAYWTTLLAKYRKAHVKYRKMHGGKLIKNPSSKDKFATVDLAIAEKIIAEGRSYKRGWSDEGDVESGPMGGSLKGFRLGKYQLEEGRNGSITLFGPGKDDFRQIYNSSMGTKDPRVRKIVEVFRAMKLNPSSLRARLDIHRRKLKGASKRDKRDAAYHEKEIAAIRTEMKRKKIEKMSMKKIGSQEKIIIIALDRYGGKLPVKAIPSYMLQALANLQEMNVVEVKAGTIHLKPMKVGKAHKKNFDPSLFTTISAAIVTGGVVTKKLLGNPKRHSPEMQWARTARGEDISYMKEPRDIQILEEKKKLKGLVIQYRLLRTMMSIKDVEQILKKMYPGMFISQHYSMHPKGTYGAVLKKSRSKKLLGNPSQKKKVDWGQWTQYVYTALAGKQPLHDIARRVEDGTGVSYKKAFDFVGKIKKEFIRDLRIAPPQDNPPKGAVKIYDRIYAIEAQKGKDSNFPKENFRHDFTKTDSEVLGLPDGSLAVRSRSGKRLWKIFNYPEKDLR